MDENTARRIGITYSDSRLSAMLISSWRKFCSQLRKRRPCRPARRSERTTGLARRWPRPHPRRDRRAAAQPSHIAPVRIAKSIAAPAHFRPGSDIRALKEQSVCVAKVQRQAQPMANPGQCDTGGENCPAQMWHKGRHKLFDEMLHSKIKRMTFQKSAKWDIPLIPREKAGMRVSIRAPKYGLTPPQGED